MLKKLFQNKVRILFALVIVLLLAGIRAFEDKIFYDPFSDYFKSDYLNLPFPEFQPAYLFLSMTLRYVLNAFFSLAIIQVLFNDWSLTRFAAVLYAVFFVILMSIFFSLLSFSDRDNNFMLFYVRRFLIQPLFVLLFVPAFYYQLFQNKK